MYWGMQHPVLHFAYCRIELKVDKLSLYSKIIGIMRLRKDMVKNG